MDLPGENETEYSLFLRFGFSEDFRWMELLNPFMHKRTDERRVDVGDEVLVTIRKKYVSGRNAMSRTDDNSSHI